ncbi:Nucleoside recognition protein [Candidatus Magnetomoraceae bacterium gMMP-15]
MAHKKNKSNYKSFLISSVISAIILISGLYLIENITFSQVISKLLWPILRLLFFISIGLAVGQIIEAAGWTKFLAWMARPIFKFSNLGEHCSAAFMTAFFSGTAANAMLINFYKEGKIQRKQVYLTNLVNQLPAYFLHVPTTFFIVLPLTGVAGILYFLITFTATILRTILFLLYGHFTPAKHKDDYKDIHETSNVSDSQKSIKGIVKKLRKVLPNRMAGICVYVIPIYIAVFILNGMGMFEAVRNWLAGYVVTTFIPMESLSVIILSLAAEFTSGFAAAGALLDAGVLTTKQTVIALLIGNIIAFPMRALRHQLPRYIGIFAPKMGIQLLLIGQSFRIFSLIIVGVMFFLFF